MTECKGCGTIGPFDLKPVCPMCGTDNSVGSTVPDEMTSDQIFSEWTDADVLIGGVVAVGSKCLCGDAATTVVASPRWGAWDACSRCAVEQFAALHGLDSLLTDDGRERALHRAVNSIKLDRMLGTASPLMCEGECGSELPPDRIGFCDDCLEAASNAF